MNEVDLRALVREAVARHLGHAPIGPSPATPVAPAPRPASSASAVHVSHVRYLTLAGGGDACLIEPSVACNHCGYCQSHGH